MKAVIQRVHEAQVYVNKEVAGKIQHGLLVYICFESEDNLQLMQKMIKKITGLRIFEDNAGKMNLNIKQVQGEILSISQFTLSWDGKKGNRPSFERSMAPELAQKHYEQFNRLIEQELIKLEKGIFGADMKVQSTNDGPVTFHLSF